MAKIHFIFYCVSKLKEKIGDKISMVFRGHSTSWPLQFWVSKGLQGTAFRLS